jgi:hypothetical protein
MCYGVFLFSIFIMFTVLVTLPYACPVFSKRFEYPELPVYALRISCAKLDLLCLSYVFNWTVVNAAFFVCIYSYMRHCVFCFVFEKLFSFVSLNRFVTVANLFFRRCRSCYFVLAGIGARSSAVD